MEILNNRKRIQNIHNSKRKIYVFERVLGELKITTDDTFYPYYYEPDPKGKFVGYDGQKLRRIVCSEPSEVGSSRSLESYESDIIFTKRYILDRDIQFERADIKFIMLDIEIHAKEFPDPKKAEYPVSCITVYNSASRGYKQWFLPEFGSETEMLDSFVEYIAYEQPDLLLAWYMNFDYVYLHNRIKDFARRISPIGQCRYGGGSKDTEKNFKLLYPAGISICDYYAWYKRIFKGLKDYTLDTVLNHEFGKGKTYKKVDFGSLTREISLRNMEDVKGMVAVEDKHKIVHHYDEMRRFLRVDWEDMTMNSRGIDMCLLTEAKKRGIVLPRKPQNDDEGNDDEKEFEGAFREAFELGVFYNDGKYDLSGAYLYTIIDFCLDPANISTDGLEIPVSDRKTNTVVEVFKVKQNKNAILPAVVEKLVNMKNEFKDLRNKTPKNDPNYEVIDKKYAAIKEIVLSAWGVIGLKFFRMYDRRVASMITSLVRELIQYIRVELEKKGYKVRYIDTDSCFCKDDNSNITELLNTLVHQWAKERYNKETSIRFDYEGRFEKVLILAKCHYYGYLVGRKKPEIKGVEVKRSSSSKYEAFFQETLINKVLDGMERKSIVEWVKTEKERIKTIPVFEVAFPCKIGTEEYDNFPIFLRAYENSKKLFRGFTINKGESYYYVYVDTLGKDAKNNVVAIKEDMEPSQLSSVRVDWKEMSKRNIMNKADKIFNVMGWGGIDPWLSNQMRLF